MRKETAKKILKMFKSVSKDETRLHLTGVNIKRLEEHVYQLTATDGYTIVQCKIGDDTIVWESSEDSVIIDSLKKFDKYSDRLKEKFITSYQMLKNISHKDAPLGTTTFNDSHMLHSNEEKPANLIHRQYPRIDSLPYMNLSESEYCEQLNKKEWKFSFNVEYLKNLVESMESTKVKTVTLHLGNKRDTLKPIPVTINSPDTDLVERALIMPCKI